MSPRPPRISVTKAGARTKSRTEACVVASNLSRQQGCPDGRGEALRCRHNTTLAYTVVHKGHDELWVLRAEIATGACC